MFSVLSYMDFIENVNLFVVAKNLISRTTIYSFEKLTSQNL